MMRPTGEASRPVSGDFVCRLSEISALRHPPCAAPHRAAAPGFTAIQPHGSIP